MKLSIEWGKTSVTYVGGKVVTFKDAKAWSVSNKSSTNEGAIMWDWLADGTQHNPGVSQKAVESIIEHAGDVETMTIILTEGFDGRLLVSDELVNWITSQGFKPLVLRSSVGVEMFNYLVSRGENVAILSHSTC